MGRAVASWADIADRHDRQPALRGSGSDRRRHPAGARAAPRAVVVELDRASAPSPVRSLAAERGRRGAHRRQGARDLPNRRRRDAPLRRSRARAGCSRPAQGPGRERLMATAIPQNRAPLHGRRDCSRHGRARRSTGSCDPRASAPTRAGSPRDLPSWRWSATSSTVTRFSTAPWRKAHARWWSSKDVAIAGEGASIARLGGGSRGRHAGCAGRSGARSQDSLGRARACLGRTLARRHHRIGRKDDDQDGARAGARRGEERSGARHRGQPEQRRRRAHDALWSRREPSLRGHRGRHQRAG